VEISLTAFPGETDSPREVRIRKILSVVSILAGAVWVAMVIIPPVVKYFSNQEDNFTLLFLLTMIPLLTIPGFICLWFGTKLFKKRTEESLRAIVGTSVFLLIVGVGFPIAEWLKPFFPDFGWEGSGMLFFAIATVIVYPMAVSRLLPVIGGERKSPRSFISKGMLTLIAFLLFFSLSSLEQAYFPLRVDREFTDLPLLDAMLQFLIVAAPMLIPYVGYRLAVQYFFGEEA
jgi:hypothetical protein